VTKTTWAELAIGILGYVAGYVGLLKWRYTQFPEEPWDWSDRASCWVGSAIFGYFVAVIMVGGVRGMMSPIQ
jgi:hypothetical protein